MQLHRIQIANFRGISQIDLTLDEDATALFGENNWGKTSLVVALSRCLGSEVREHGLFGLDDFHRVANNRASIAKRLHVTLWFRLRATESWLDPRLAALGWQDAEGNALLGLRFAAERFGHGECRSRRSFVGEDGSEILPADGNTLIDAVIRLHPALRFKDMMLTDWLEHPRLATNPPVAAPELPANDAVRAVFERILNLPHQLHPQELGQGLAAMQRLLGEHRQLLGERPPDQRTAEDIAAAPLSFRSEDSLIELAQRSGSGLRRVALLMLLGGLLAARGEHPLADDAEPILVMEDPETHLHPIQLALMWGLIEQLPLQKLVTTNSGELLASFPQQALRRLVRQPAHIEVYQLAATALSLADARKVAFHIRSNRASSMFARVWLLVEGETEFWLLPELARIAGVNFATEGIRCVEFAQTGLAPLIKFADHLGIRWHVLCDGDDAGQKYLQRSQAQLRGREQARHITALPSRDIEHFLWDEGYADVFRAAITPKTNGNPWHDAALARQEPPPDEEVINRALRYHSKPGMALEIAEAAEIKGREAIPALLLQLFATVQHLAADAT
ncbi:DUF2813 domain-containing protein [Chitinilyticum piscinae]|uniref:DUF2813 domain-containing protein n=1 Tax=Chitinilyticum piscinae TaxID=2866724 RepID=A0A8J7FIA9_9NEIS|nr:DUF2813 domain-containing protein [Chitinilyticum piscinae]MBE9608312.1 DUF2813 domain-containing protein [Chitinilyticum piscinae]